MRRRQNSTLMSMESVSMSIGSPCTSRKIRTDLANIWNAVKSRWKSFSNILLNRVVLLSLGRTEKRFLSFTSPPEWAAMFFELWAWLQEHLLAVYIIRAAIYRIEECTKAAKFRLPPYWRAPALLSIPCAEGRYKRGTENFKETKSYTLDSPLYDRWTLQTRERRSRDRD